MTLADFDEWSGRIFLRCTDSGQPMPARGSGVEKVKPGSEGTTTSKASAGSPPNAAGSASGRMTLWKSQKVQGQPWFNMIGSGFGPPGTPLPGSWMKWIGTPSMTVRKCAKPFIAASCRRQS